ncbi:MAG: DNA-binding protein [Candidatus Dechloromonas phosphoritropha]|jgi:gp16 family phage-associated protein
MKTSDQVRAEFKEEGITITKWAQDRGYPLNKVYRVLSGIEKGYYGKAHEIAVALGIKPEPPKSRI